MQEESSGKFKEVLKDVKMLLKAAGDSKTVRTALDNGRAQVTMGELVQFKEAHTIVLPSFDKEVCKEAAVIEGAEVMTRRLEEQGTQKSFVKTWKIR